MVADPDPHYKLDLEPHQSQNSGVSESQNRAVDSHKGGLETQTEP